MCDIWGLGLYLGLMVVVYIAILFRRKAWFVSCMLLIIIACIAAFRGSAGVDTLSYITRFNNIQGVHSIWSFEVVLPTLMYVVKFYIANNFVVFSIIYGIILALLYTFFFRKSSNAIYFALCMFPVIFLDSLFNGVRVGLAYPLIFISIYYRSSFFYALAFLSHISAIIIGPLKIIPLRYFMLLAIIVLAAHLYFDFTYESLLSGRYQDKIAIYSVTFTRSWYSGIADSFMLFIASFLYIWVRFKSKQFYYKVSLVILVCILIMIAHVFFISQYAFMLRVVRLLDVVIFALLSRMEVYDSKYLIMFCILVGIVYDINFLRQISMTCYYDHGGFLPLNLTANV